MNFSSFPLVLGIEHMVLCLLSPWSVLEVSVVGGLVLAVLVPGNAAELQSTQSRLGDSALVVYILDICKHTAFRRYQRDNNFSCLYVKFLILWHFCLHKLCITKKMYFYFINMGVLPTLFFFVRDAYGGQEIDALHL